MKKLLFLPILLISLSCLSQSKKQSDIYLKEGGEIAKDYTPCKLVSVKRTMQGLNHLFVADSGDSMYVIIQFKRLDVGKCYYVPNKYRKLK